ncbi:aspartate/glutamate racemase family protein [Marinobacterium sp. YM272]|uniref:aspartate/glutamate racemase family protein n=1 Tax=Marinobacterium sp. YM272 TaxID=3421654 RepID=UPI003D7F9865
MTTRMNEAGASQRRLLVINPNTNRTISARVQSESEKIADTNTAITVVNPEFGPLSIETAEHRSEAVPLVISLAESSLSAGYDAYALACFDDIGLFEVRRMAGVPVVGPCEAGIAAARTVAERFTIVTTVHSAVPGIKKLIERYGVSDICTVRAAGIGVAAAAAGNEATEEIVLKTIKEAIELDGAQAIVLGSGGLTGSALSFSQRAGVPVIDAVMAAVKMAEGLASMRSISRRYLDSAVPG